MQPVREHFGGVLASHGAGKTQSALAQNALVRVGTQKGFHQHREPRLLWFLTGRHLQRVVDLRQQRAAFAVGQEAVVAHHFKVSGRDVADVTPQHLLLAQFLAFVLLRVVVVILVNNRTTTVMAELRRRYRRPFQIAAQIFHAAPGATGLFGEVDLPVALILRLQVTLPLLRIADMTEVGQLAGIDAIVAGTQQADNGTAPYGFNLLFFEKQIAPDCVFDIETAAGDGNVDVRVLIELASVGVLGAEDADFNAQLARVPEHGTGGAAKQVIEQWPVVVEERPQQVRHGEGDMLPVAVRQNVLLLCNPLLGALEAAAAAGLGLAGLTEKTRVGTVRRTAAIAANAHGAGPAGKHALDREFGPVRELMTILLEEEFPALVVLEQKLCRSRYVHDAQYKMR